MVSTFSLVSEKAFRFFIGLLVTVLSIFIGTWHGKKLRSQGITGENYYQRNQMTRMGLLRLFLVAGIAVGLFFFLDRCTMALHLLSPYFTQFSVVALRSLLCFLYAFQWRIWEDKTRLWRSGAIVLIAILVFVVVEGLILFPAHFLIGRQVHPSGVVIQSTNVTCCPTALTNIMRLYGVNIWEKDTVLAMKVGLTGTTDTEAAEGAKLLGFPYAEPIRPTLERMIAEDLPLIVSIDSSGDPHAVAVFGISSFSVVIADPHVGLVQYTHSDFKRIMLGNAIRIGAPSFSYKGKVSLSNFDEKKFQETSLAMEKER